MPPDADKDLPLRDDTRLLGRLLGDVLRAQAGEDGYARIEAIRQTAIRFRRAQDADAAAVRAELSALLNGLPVAQALDVVRAFSYFSHLANIAEDMHQNRRRRAHALAGSPPQRGSLADTIDRLHHAGVDGDALARWFADARVSPVLTAHPTEVQRKSILDAEREIARLLTWRDRTALTPDEAADLEGALYRQVLGLWQTAMLRLSKLQVVDEIDNGLAYYRYTFLAEVPRLYAGLEARAARAAALPAGWRAAALPADGVVDRRRSRRQPVRHRRYAGAGGAGAGGRRVRALSRRGAPAGRRTVAVEPACDADARRCSRCRRPRTTAIRTARTSPIDRR